MGLLKKKEEEEASQAKEENSTEAKKAEKKSSPPAKKKVASVPVKVGGNSVFITNPDFLDAVTDASYGTFVSVTANNGTHMTTTKEDLGKVLKFQAIVASEVKKVSPGSNDEEAKDYFAVSTDGENVADGRSLEEALDEAIAAGYTNASIKTYIDVICLIVDCENEGFIGETVTLQLAPSSQFTWKPLAGKCKMRAALGKLEAAPVAGDPELGTAVIFTCTATPTSYKGKDFTKFEFSI